MTEKQGKLRKFFSKDILEVLKKPTSVIETGTELSKTVLEFALAAGFLGSPLAPAGIAIAGFSCVGLTTKGIKFYLDKTKNPTLEECVVIASRLAYVERLDNIFRTIKNE